MQAPHASTLVLLIVVPLLAWRMYSRMRRLVGRQRLSRLRPWLTLLIFPLLLLALALGARHEPVRLLWLVAAAAAGVGLGRFGLARTRFEPPTPEGLFYTPHAHLGIALSALLAGRIVWRLIELTLIDPAMPRDLGHFARSPFTLAVFGLMAGYYVRYAVGLLQWRFSLPPAAPSQASTEPRR